MRTKPMRNLIRQAHKVSSLGELVQNEILVCSAIQLGKLATIMMLQFELLPSSATKLAILGFLTERLETRLQILD